MAMRIRRQPPVLIIRFAGTMLTVVQCALRRLSRVPRVITPQ